MTGIDPNHEHRDVDYLPVTPDGGFAMPLRRRPRPVRRAGRGPGERLRAWLDAAFRSLAAASARIASRDARRTTAQHRPACVRPC
jgi:hypothetical protein